MKRLVLTVATVMTAVGIAHTMTAIADEEPTPTPTPTPIPKTLGDMAKGVQLKGSGSEDAKKSGIVINDQNLGDYSTKGRMTTAKPVLPPPNVNSMPALKSGDVDEKREYWRNQYVEQKELIASLERQIKELDLLIPRLWTDFYAHDDPAYRDGVIKVNLDEALLKRKNLEQRLAEEKPKPNEILQEARRDGAEPGWFRDIK